MEIKLTSDFAAVRIHLDRAQYYLRGNDDVSREARLAIDLVLEEVITAEHRKPRAEILDFQRVKAL